MGGGCLFIICLLYAFSSETALAALFVGVFTWKCGPTSQHLIEALGSTELRIMKYVNLMKIIDFSLKIRVFISKLHIDMYHKMSNIVTTYLTSTFVFYTRKTHIFTYIIVFLLYACFSQTDTPVCSSIYIWQGADRRVSTDPFQSFCDLVWEKLNTCIWWKLFISPS